MSTGLASLTANYTDSEEEEHEGPQTGDEGDDSHDEAAAGPRPAPAAPVRNLTPLSTGGGSRSASAKSTPTKTMRLVSYAEEAEEEEARTSEGGGPEDDGSVPMDLDSENGGEDSSRSSSRKSESESTMKEEDEDQEANPADDSVSGREGTGVEVEAWSGGVQQLPPEPPGQCEPSLQENINKILRRKQTTGFDMNSVIQNKKGFRNPSIYEKLISFCDIDEYGTNFPKELYDGHLFGQDSYYDVLGKVQNADIERREKAAKVRKEKAASVAAAILEKQSKAPDEASSSSSTSNAGLKRKSKWDQQGAPAANISSLLPPTKPATKMATLKNVPAPTLVSAAVPQQPAPVTSASASTSSKTISAFGPLKK